MEQCDAAPAWMDQPRSKPELKPVLRQKAQVEPLAGVRPAEALPQLGSKQPAWQQRGQQEVRA